MQEQSVKNPYRNRWPFSVYVSIFILLVISGIVDAAYLAYSHYRVHTDIYYSSFCAINQALNCDTVSQSPYAVFLHVPVSLWGLIGYVLLALLTIGALSRNARQERLWSLIVLVCAIFCGLSLWLAYISSVKIHSYCLMCIVSYAINLLLLFSGHVVRTRYGKSSFWQGLAFDFDFLWRYRRQTMKIFLPFILAVGLVVGALPRYWTSMPLTIPAGIGQGITEDGHPWIGANNPVLEITEFSDYQCFQCWKMHQILRRIIEENPDKIRLIHVHYPMDHKVNPIVTTPFHEGAGLMAKMAIHAMDQGKFWEMNDYLYMQWRQKGEINTHQGARDIGLNAKEMGAAVRSKYVEERLLKMNIRRGMKIRLMGTPGFLIDGQLYQGTLPFEKIEDLRKH